MTNCLNTTKSGTSNSSKSKPWRNTSNRYLESKGFAFSLGIRLHDMQSVDVDTYDTRNDETMKVSLSPVLRLRTKAFGVCDLRFDMVIDSEDPAHTGRPSSRMRSITILFEFEPLTHIGVFLCSGRGAKGIPSSECFSLPGYCTNRRSSSTVFQTSRRTDGILRLTTTLVLRLSISLNPSTCAGCPAVVICMFIYLQLTFLSGSTADGRGVRA